MFKFKSRKMLIIYIKVDQDVINGSNTFNLDSTWSTYAMTKFTFNLIFYTF